MGTLCRPLLCIWEYCQPNALNLHSNMNNVGHIERVYLGRYACKELPCTHIEFKQCPKLCEYVAYTYLQLQGMKLPQRNPSILESYYKLRHTQVMLLLHGGRVHCNDYCRYQTSLVPRRPSLEGSTSGILRVLKLFRRNVTLRK